MTRTPAPRENLPKIVAYIGVTDSGEYGAATCPHCGADGRYVHTFVCEDGTRRGAMAGCVQLFPIHPLAAEHKKLVERAKDREAKGWSLASWDQAKLDAIAAVAGGRMTADEALDIVRRENRKRDEWQTKKYGRRR